MILTPIIQSLTEKTLKKNEKGCIDMENVFEELLGEDIAADNEQGEEEAFDHSFDLTNEDLGDEEDMNDANDSQEGISNEDNQPTNATNAAFAQMRTQNKEYQNKISEFENLAKSLGMKDADEFIAKAKQAQIQRQAKQKGIPLEIAQELEEMRNLKDEIIAEREEAEIKAKESNFVSSLHTFVNENKLSEAAVDKLSQDLEKDGFDVNSLMDMPVAALNRILSSYVCTSYQKNLERKNTIRKELPINQSSKVDVDSLNKEIDKLARELAGK
jgi:hypothetical protein